MKCKLLVAEDELIERKVLCRTLQKYLGDLISLYEAKNGREALEIFAREAPQVAVLDIEICVRAGYSGRTAFIYPFFMIRFVAFV